MENIDVGIKDALLHKIKPTKKKLSGLLKHVGALVAGPGSSNGDVTTKMDGATLQGDSEAKADFRQVAEVMCVLLHNVLCSCLCILMYINNMVTITHNSLRIIQNSQRHTHTVP